MELGTSRLFMLLRVALMEPPAQLEGWFCAMAVSLAQRPLAALMEADLFSSLRPAVAEIGISGQFIRLEVSRTVVSPMARCCLIVWATSTERLITAELMVSALFTSYLPGLSANGTRVCSIASRKEATAIAPSAILLLTASAICMVLRVRVAWVVALSLS